MAVRMEATAAAQPFLYLLAYPSGPLGAPSAGAGQEGQRTCGA